MQNVNRVLVSRSFWLALIGCVLFWFTFGADLVMQALLPVYFNDGWPYLGLLLVTTLAGTLVYVIRTRDLPTLAYVILGLMLGTIVSFNLLMCSVAGLSSLMPND